MLGLSACGGRYDIGSGEGGAAGAAGDESEEGVGGSSVGNSGGKGATVGSGGSSIGSGGSSIGSGGSSIGSGGSSIGSGGSGIAGGNSASAGSGGADVYAYPCVYPEPPSGFAEPAVAWARMSTFLFDEVRPPLEPLPEQTTLAWAQSQLDLVIDGIPGDGDVPAGLDALLRRWAFSDIEGSEEAANQWSNQLFLGSVAVSLFAGGGLNERTSFLAEPSFLRAHPSAAQRGTWIAKEALCEEIGLPPVSDVTLPVPGPGETLRQALSAATSAPACAGCHSLVNPLGFAFSHYDAAGEYQETENGLPIDASGTHNGNSFSWEFDGLGELNSLLAYSEEVTHCVPRRLLGNAIEEVRGDGFESPNFSAEADYVVCEVVNSYRSARKMVRAIASSPSILGQ